MRIPYQVSTLFAHDKTRTHNMSLRDRISTRPRYKWYVLGVLTAVYASSHVDHQIMGILLEPIKIELDASDTQMGFLVGLTFALFLRPSGCPSPCLQTARTGAISLPPLLHSGA
jgi:hypothetical protein